MQQSGIFASRRLFRPSLSKGNPYQGLSMISTSKPGFPCDVGADQYSSVSGTWYKILPTIGSNGTIFPFIQTAVPSDASQQFIVTPKTGYTASFDGTCGGSASDDAYSTDDHYTTNAITANCTVTVSLSNSSTHYTITASAGSNGSISPSGSVQVNSGGSQAFSFTPATGYQDQASW